MDAQRDIRKVRRAPLVVKFSRQQKDELEQAARQQGLSQNEFVRRAVDRAIMETERSRLDVGSHETG